MYTLSKAPLITEDEIKTRVIALAEKIKSEYAFDILVGVMTGSFMFVSDLGRLFEECEIQVQFIKASSYKNSMHSGALQISGIENLDISGKKILLVDDIIDTGKTLKALVEVFKERGAIAKTCVLLDKKARRTVEYTPDFTAFEIEDKFVVGYGLDYAEKYRLYPEIWTLEND